MEKLLIIDGSYLLFQSFYGMPRPIRSKGGERIEAAICFLGILGKTIKELKPDFVYVIFDGETELKRKDEYEDYKTNRIDYSLLDVEENPYAQLPLIQSMLDFYQIAYSETKDMEGDDFIAGIVNRYKNSLDIYISSGDRDFFQLICDNVKVFAYRGKLSKIWDKAAIIEKYGFDPKYFATYKALIGDQSDNIKGIKGIGPKSATKLILEHGSLDEIFEHIDNIKQRELLLNFKELCYKNLQIIRLDNANPLELNLADCKKYCENINAIKYLKENNLL